MNTRARLPIVAVLFAAFTLPIQSSAQADTFGSGANTFDISFVNIGNAGNAGDTGTHPVWKRLGAVPYEYRMGTYEISQNAIDKATASGMANVTAGQWTGNQPAGAITWYEAAAFVNWLNTSTGKQAAYDLSWSGTAWSMNLWSSADAWTIGGTNLFRHKDAFYFLPSENEWYKAAYYNPAGSNYFLYPTGSDTAPTAVASGTDAGTAVYNNAANAPAGVDVAGGLSPYGTMGQGGNLWEWNETTVDGNNSSPSDFRVRRGGIYFYPEGWLTSPIIGADPPDSQNSSAGFRVASVPEPSTYALLALAAAGLGAQVLRCRRK
jgi:hypothetical protein